MKGKRLGEWRMVRLQVQVVLGSEFSPEYTVGLTGGHGGAKVYTWSSHGAMQRSSCHCATLRLGSP